MRTSTTAAVAVVAAVGISVAGCGSSGSSSSSSNASSGKKGDCVASIGLMAPITGQVAQLGGEELHFTQLAVDMDNKANGTKIKLIQGDTQLMPSQATTVSQQFIANNDIVAIVGPAGSQEVSAIGPLLGRAGLAMVSGSATAANLTSGANPTFFRVVSKDSVQGPQDARFAVSKLKPKKVMIVDDQTSYSTGLAKAMTPVFEKAGVKVDHESVSQKVTDFSSLVSKVDAQTGAVMLPWQVAANAQQFGKNLAEQNKKAVIVGTDGLYSPTQFKIPGSYVSSFGPDITAIPSAASIAKAAKAKYGTFGTYGPPNYAATHVIDEAIASVCKAGQKPSRSNVLAQIKKTDEPTSILGQRISFDSHGDRKNATFFLFHINAKGDYKLVPQP